MSLPTMEDASSHAVPNCAATPLSLPETQETTTNAVDVSATEFTLFPKLTIELRLKIWKFADINLHEHDVRVEVQNCKPIEGSTEMVNPRFKLLTSIPVLFHVCRESRAEATKKYIAVFASYDGEDRRSIYLNPKVDTLFIRIPFWNCVWASDTFICDHDRESTTQSDDGNMLPGSDLASRTTVVALNPRRNTAWWKERLVVVVHSEEEFASLIADEEDSESDPDSDLPSDYGHDGVEESEKLLGDALKRIGINRFHHKITPQIHARPTLHISWDEVWEKHFKHLRQKVIQDQATVNTEPAGFHWHGKNGEDPTGHQYLMEDNDA